MSPVNSLNTATSVAWGQAPQCVDAIADSGEILNELHNLLAVRERGRPQVNLNRGRPGTALMGQSVFPIGC